MTASVSTRVLLLKSPLTSWAGPYMSQVFVALIGFLRIPVEGWLLLTFREAGGVSQKLAHLTG